MLRPHDKEYNVDPIYTDEKMMISVTINQLIKSLQKAKNILGGDCVVMIAGDDGSGYDEIRSIYGENFHDNLILTLSSDWNPHNSRKPIEFLDVPENE